MWDELSEWWSSEVASDPAYVEEVIPLLVGYWASPEWVRRYLTPESARDR